MNAAIQVLGNLVPLITTPISLVAFAVFVVLFLLVKVLLAAKVIGPVAQHQGFSLLNKILNIAGIALLLIIILAFGAHIYGEKLSHSTRSKDVRVARHEINKLIDTAKELKAEGVTITARQRLIELQPHIFAVGQLLDPAVAIAEIERIRDLVGIAEVTPALLAVSDETMPSLMSAPFNYFPVEIASADAVYTPNSHQWVLPAVDSGLGTVSREYIELLLDRPPFPYKDIVYFLAATPYEDWDGPYSDSLLKDAADYVRIRAALIDARYLEAINYADQFIRKYGPDGHRHVDDAYALEVVAMEGLGDGLGALQAIENVLRIREGDMRYWFVNEAWVVVEQFLTATQIADLEKRIRSRRALDVLEYTRAHDLVAERRYTEAVQVFELLSDRPSVIECAEQLDYESDESVAASTPSQSDVWFDLPAPRCVPLEYVSTDKKLIKHLGVLSSDASPEGLFKFAVALAENELVHYNRVLGVGRSAKKQRTPKRYFETRNNYYLAATMLAEAEKTAKSRHLAQKIRYKLGRCYEYLAFHSAFYRDAIGGRDRMDYARLAIATFQEAHAIDKDGPLADDALAEAGVNKWLLLGDHRGASRVLTDVSRSYGGRNAEDNALYWRAVIADSTQNAVEAAALWGQLGAVVASDRLRRLIQERMDTQDVGS